MFPWSGRNFHNYEAIYQSKGNSITMELEKIGGWTIHDYISWLDDYSRTYEKTRWFQASSMKKGEFRECLNREHPYLINPVLFSFLSPVFIFSDGDEPITLCLDARNLPDVRIVITENFLRQDATFRKEKREFVRFSRLSDWLEQYLTSMSANEVRIQTPKLNHAVRKHLYSLFDQPTTQEIAIGLLEDRDLWVEDLHLWPSDKCSNCSQPLVHPVSKLLGIGPECGGHEYEYSEEVIESFRLVMSRFDDKLYFQIPPQLNPILFARLRKIVESQRTN